MRISKVILSSLLSVMLLFSLTACDTSQPEPTGTKQTIQNITKAEDVKIDVNQLYEANTIAKLLSTYDTIKVYEKSDTVDNFCQYFNYDDGLGAICKYKSTYEAEMIEGWVKGMYFTVKPERVMAYSYLEEDIENPIFPYEGIFDQYTTEISFDVMETKEDYYKLNVKYADMDKKESHIYTVDKATLALKKVVTDYGDGNPISYEFIYNEEIEDFGLLQGFNDELKKVSVIGEVTSYEEETTITEFTMEVPKDWEYYPNSYQELTLYTNKDYTELYEYPGHGVDYTIYATTSKG